MEQRGEGETAAEKSPLPPEQPPSNDSLVSATQRQISTDSAEKIQQNSLQYVKFRRTSRTSTNENGEDLLQETNCIADYYAQEAHMQDFVNQSFEQLQKNFSDKSTNLEKYAQEELLESGVQYFYPYSNYMEQEISRHDSRVVSLVAINHVYSGGIHPNSFQTAENLDLQTMRQLKLEDVIYEERIEEFQSLVRDLLQERFRKLDLELFLEDCESTISKSLSYGSMTPYWYFSPQGLVIFYNQYELGPYTAGIIRIEMSYSDLEDILREEYFPAFSGEKHGNTSDFLYKTEEPPPITVELLLQTDGDILYLEAGSLVTNVQISEVFWQDEIPVMQNMWLSVGALGPGQGLSVIGGFDDSSRSFAVRFVDPSGCLRTGRLTENGISEAE